MNDLTMLFFVSAGASLLYISFRLVQLARIDRATRYWVRTIEQAPDSSVLPIIEPMSASRLEAARTLRAMELASTARR